MYWNILRELIRRNILMIVVVAVVAVVWPWTLIFIIPCILIALGILVAMWKIRRNFRNMHRQQQEPRSHKHTKNRAEGEVTIVRTEQAEQRVNDDVGEYVDFKEIKERETK